MTLNEKLNAATSIHQFFTETTPVTEERFTTYQNTAINALKQHIRRIANLSYDDFTELHRVNFDRNNIVPGHPLRD